MKSWKFLKYFFQFFIILIFSFFWKSPNFASELFKFFHHFGALGCVKTKKNPTEGKWLRVFFCKNEMNGKEKKNKMKTKI